MGKPIMNSPESAYKPDTEGASDVLSCVLCACFNTSVTGVELVMLLSTVGVPVVDAANMCPSASELDSMS